jgi:outer membrane immunogenic protein
MKYHFKSGISVLALTAALGANTAIAADMAVKDMPLVADTSWAGFYFGANLGGAWDNASAISTTGGGPPPQINTPLASSNVLVGAHAGYNYQFNSIVFGVEGDLSGLPFGKSRIGPNATLGTVEASLSGLASLRGRIGYAFGRTLFYGTGGVGWIGENFQENSGLGKGANTLLPTNFVVPVVGGGVEYKVSSHLTAGVEGLVYLNSGNAPFANSTGRNYQFSSGNVGVVRGKVSYTW